jgi:hypothetical protein
MKHRGAYTRSWKIFHFGGSPFRKNRAINQGIAFTFVKNIRKLLDVTDTKPAIKLLEWNFMPVARSLSIIPT